MDLDKEMLDLVLGMPYLKNPCHGQVEMASGKLTHWSSGKEGDLGCLDWRVTNIWQVTEPMGLNEVSQGEGWFASKGTGLGLCGLGALEEQQVGHNAERLYRLANISPAGSQALSSVTRGHYFTFLICCGALFSE